MQASGAPAAGAAPQRVADLLRTFTAAGARRRRAPRPDGPDTIVPLLQVPAAGETPLDPGRIDAARSRLKAEAAVVAAQAAEAIQADAETAPPATVDPASFDAARSRLRKRTR